MKLLFDHNLSHKLVDRLADIFPDSTHTRLLGLSEAGDTQVWQIASDNQLTIVSQDADFLEMGLIKGFPPKLIWIRLGNSTTNEFVNPKVHRNQQGLLLRTRLGCLPPLTSGLALCRNRAI